MPLLSKIALLRQSSFILFFFLLSYANQFLIVNFPLDLGQVKCKVLGVIVLTSYGIKIKSEIGTIIREKWNHEKLVIPRVAGVILRRNKLCLKIVLAQFLLKLKLRFCRSNYVQ